MSSDAADMPGAEPEEGARLTRPFVGGRSADERLSSGLRPFTLAEAITLAGDSADAAETAAAEIRAVPSFPRHHLEQEHAGMNDAATHTFADYSPTDPAPIDAGERATGGPVLDEASIKAAEEYRQHAMKALGDLIEWSRRSIETLLQDDPDPQPALDVMSWVEAAAATAQDAVSRRAAVLSGPAPAAPVEPAAPVASPEPAPSYPPEAYLVAATRAIEAVKSHADQALMGFQFAPREHAILLDVIDGIRRHAETGARAHLSYAALAAAG